MSGAPTADLSVSSYESLNEEIRSNSNIVANLVAVTATGSATLVGFGVQLQQPGVFLAAFMLLIPISLFIASQLETTARIAAYISVNFESEQTGVFWETDLRALQENSVRKGPVLYRLYSHSFSGMFALIGVGCVILAIRFLDYDDTGSVRATFLFSGAALILLGLTTVRLSKALSPSAVEEHRVKWEVVCSNRKNSRKELSAPTDE